MAEKRQKHILAQKKKQQQALRHKEIKAQEKDRHRQLQRDLLLARKHGATPAQLDAMQAEFDAKEEKYREEAERLEKKRLMKLEKEKEKKLEKEKRLQNYRDEKAAARRKNRVNDGATVHRKQDVSEPDGKQVNADPSQTEVEIERREQKSFGTQSAYDS